VRLPGLRRPGRGDDDLDVFRSPGAVVLWWFWAAVAAVVLIDLAIQGGGRDALIAALIVLTATGFAYAVAGRPRVEADADGIRVLNPLRDFRVPWAAVETIEVATALKIRCFPAPGRARGKLVTSWAVQSSARSAAKREFAARRAAARGGRGGLPGIGSGGGGGFNRAGGASPGYAQPGGSRMPPAAREVMNRSVADYAMGVLTERMRKIKLAQALAAVAADAAGAAAGGDAEARGDGAPAAAAGDGLSPAPPPAVPTARWAWWPIAAMVVPAAALIVTLLV
jgi:hypothetical protein